MVQLSTQDVTQESKVTRRRERATVGGLVCGAGGRRSGTKCSLQAAARARVFWRSRTGAGHRDRDRVLRTPRLSTAATAQRGSRPSGSSCKTRAARSSRCR